MNEYIFAEGDTDCSKMYFIDKGLVVLLHKKSKTQIHQLTTHESFGEIGFFASYPRSATAKASTMVDVLSLKIEKFQEALV